MVDFLGYNLTFPIHILLFNFSLISHPCQIIFMLKSLRASFIFDEILKC